MWAIVIDLHVADVAQSPWTVSFSDALGQCKYCNESINDHGCDVEELALRPLVLLGFVDICCHHC